MAQQPDISAILAALAQRPGGNTNQPNQPTSQSPLPVGYPGISSAATPSNPSAGLALPQPTNSGSLDLSGVKPSNSGSVSLADAISKARGIAANKVPQEDPRLAGRAHRRSRSRSRSPPRRENFRDNYNPYRDERRDGARRDTNGRGESASPAPVAASAFSPAGRGNAGSLNNDKETEVITVPSSSVGMIIGRAGENLRRVESETGARVQFVQSHESAGPYRQCKITGTLRQRSEAKADIFRVADEAPDRNGRQSAMPPVVLSDNQPALREGEKSMQIMVPDRTVGLIIGRGGETIRDLQERSGCHVNIVSENKSINGLRPVNLIGTREAAARAKELILEVVDSDTRTGGSAPPQQMPAMGAPPVPAPAPYDPYAGYAPPPQQAPQVPYDTSRINDVVVVPSEAVGMIIGKGGETIKDMQNSSNCKINVSPPAGADVNREIGLIGTRQSIETAKRLIWDKVGTVREKQGGFRSDPQQGAPYGDPYSQYQQQPALYGQPPANAMPAAQHIPPPDQPDPYAAYGGYHAYAAMYYAAIANQQGGPPPPGP